LHCKSYTDGSQDKLIKVLRPGSILGDDYVDILEKLSQVSLEEIEEEECMQTSRYMY
jgi:hypothetical protein